MKLECDAGSPGLRALRNPLRGGINGGHRLVDVARSQASEADSSTQKFFSLLAALFAL